MLLKITTAAAALFAATAIAGAASAQDQAAPAPADQAAPPAAAQPDANAAQSAAPAPAAAPASDTSGYNVGTPRTNPETGAQIITNGPVPDTPENRARFGKPNSHAGRRTAAAGN